MEEIRTYRPQQERLVSCGWCGEPVAARGRTGVTIAVARNESVRVHRGECRRNYETLRA